MAEWETRLNELKCGIVDESIIEFLFGLNDRKRKTHLSYEEDIVFSAYGITRFYSTLTQAFFCAYAIKEGNTLADVFSNKKQSNVLNELWAKNDEAGYSSISFLQALNEDKRIFDESTGADLIGDLLESYKARVKGRKKPYGFSKMKALLQSFVLLRNTVYEKAESGRRGSFVFTVDEERYSIDADPFFTIRDKRGYPCDTDSETARAYLLCSMRRGNHNGEIWIKAAPMFGIESESGIEIQYKVTKDNSLAYVLRAAEINSDWYEDEQNLYSAGPGFLFKAKEGIALAIKEFLDKKNEGNGWTKETAWTYFKDCFKETEIYPKLLDLRVLVEKESESELDVRRIGDECVAICLEYGISRAMSALLKGLFGQTIMCSELGGEVSFFQKCLYNILKDAEKVAFYVAQCETEKEKHMLQLQTIMSQESNGYKKRHKEIEIESETLFLLNAAGLENERLFPDVEQILSIDDYYDKLWNRDITVEENLKEVFTFLCTFYGTMFAQQGEMSEAEQRENVERIAEECSSRNAVELMRAFYDLINNNDKAFERITGRTKNENKLNRFKIRIDNLEKALKDSRDEKIGVEQLEPKAKKKFFISYSHEDRKKVHRLVCALTYELHRLEIPVDLYYDEEEFRAGDDWRNKAKTLIRSEDCLGAVLFLSKNSAQSEPVHFEFSKLQECKKRIVCVNGEMEKLSEWLGKMQKQVEKKTSERVSDFCEYYQTSRIFVPFWDKKAKEENLEDCVKTLIEEIRKEYKEHKEKNAQNDMGRVITEPIKQAANLYVALKMGIFNSYDSTGEWDVVFSGENYELNECIYPLVLSLKETRIKRDNVIMFGYEIITKKGDSNFPIRYLLSSKKLDADDYYCIPHCRRVGEKCSWMVDPYLVRDDVFECLRAQK